MKARQWTTAVLVLAGCALIGAGFLHHQQRLDALLHRQLDDTALPSLRGELDALRALHIHLQTELRQLVSQLSALDDSHARLEQRLDRHQTQLSTMLERPDDPRWQTLIQRIEQLEVRPVPVVRPVAQARKPAARPAPARLALPPLPQPLGLELRGTERFVAVAPADSQTLAAARLLRPGDRFGAWTLQRLDARAAVFSAPGQSEQTLPLP